MDVFPFLLGCLMVGIGVAATRWAKRSRVDDVEADLESQSLLSRLLWSGSVNTHQTASWTVFWRWGLAGCAFVLGAVLVVAGLSG